MAIQNGNVEWARELRGRITVAHAGGAPSSERRVLKCRTPAYPQSEAVSLTALTKVAPREPLLVLDMEMGFFVGWLKSVIGDANHGHVRHPNPRYDPPLP